MNSLLLRRVRVMDESGDFPRAGDVLAEDGVIRRNYRHLSRKGFNIWQKRRPRA